MASEACVNPDEHFKGLIKTYRANRDKVPVEVLRTKYRQAYQKLLNDIALEAARIVVRAPPEMAGLKIREEGRALLREVCIRSFREGGYAEKIKASIRGRVDVETILALLHEANGRFWEEWEAELDNRACLVTGLGEDGSFAQPKVYCHIAGLFWEQGKWREPRPGERVPALGREGA